MGSLINFPGLQMPTPWVLPSIYTPARIERMGRANSVARKLRALGYRIVAEDPIPDDDGSPIIQLDVGTLPQRSLIHLGDCLVTDTKNGVQRTVIDGVRVFWQMGRVS